MDFLLSALKAAAEPTRLRLLALCGRGELTVSDLVQILGQSQPRISRHLKLLCDAGLLDRFPEGTWAFYRLAERGRCASLARTLIAAIPPDDLQIIRDSEREEAIKRQRAEAAAAYFRLSASRWHEIRRLHVPEPEVEAVLLRLVDDRPLSDLLDIGTGTGRMLELFGPRVRHGLGLDQSREMLAIARANLEQAGLRHCQVRQADMYQLPLDAETFDLVLIHQVLHFAESPAVVIAEAARVLRPGGLLLVADFARHDLETLRVEHAHRRLGFADEEVAGWCHQAGLRVDPVVHLPGTPLTVTVWPALRSGAIAVTTPAVPTLALTGAA
ncbi:MAG: metalloregulator ArsR/SmtB family transcription factor [Azospirillaceae bacterium]|nr:metalloregulator ArsR/SmtB family transcription factor [Azospirillaceae bacterium]